MSNFFDTPNVSTDAGEFQLLPDGEYFAELTSSEIKQNAKGTGDYVRVNFTVSGKDSKGTDHGERKISSFFNIKHTNPMAQQIGRAEFKRLLAAVGVEDALAKPEDFETRCHFKTLYVHVISEEGKDGKTRNRINQYIAKKERKKADTASDDNLDEIPF